MVMVIERLLLGQNHRLRCGQAVEASSPGLKTISLRVRFVCRQTFANLDSIRRDIVIQARQEHLPMSDQFWLTKAQLERIEPFFPRTRGIPRVDDRRVVSGIVQVIRNVPRWRDAPALYALQPVR
jgi:hypothetical protein